MKLNIIIYVSFLLVSSGDVNADTLGKTGKSHLDIPQFSATLGGHGVYKSHQGNVSLTLSCHGDVPHIQATLRAEGQLVAHFPTNIFDGPGAMGEKARLVSVRIDHQSLQRAWYSSGAYRGTHAFEWSFALQNAEMKRWIRAAGTSLTVFVSVPVKGGEPLTAVFALPYSSAALQTIVAPCMNKDN